MIKVRRVGSKERKYCTHCDNRAVYVLYFTNPVIIQQGSNGALCGRCMGGLKKAIEKATAPVKNNKVMRKSRRILTGKEARYAAKHGLSIWYEERYYDPQDKYKEFNGPSLALMVKRCCISYVDIQLESFKDGELVTEDFDEGWYKVYGVVGVKYSQDTGNKDRT